MRSVGQIQKSTDPYSYSDGTNPCISNSCQSEKSDLYYTDPESHTSTNRFLPSSPPLSSGQRRNSLEMVVQMKSRAYLVLTSSFVCFAVALLFLLSPQSFPFFSAPRLKDCAKIGANDKWSLFYHLGGNGPWIPRVDDVVEGGIDAPEGCKIDMIHMVCQTKP